MSDGEDFDAIDAPAPAEPAVHAPATAHEIRDEPQVHAHGADFLWLYDKPQAINAATHAVMEPEPVADACHRGGGNPLAGSAARRCCAHVGDFRGTPGLAGQRDL